jgi:hypothetical protein
MRDDTAMQAGSLPPAILRGGRIVCLETDPSNLGRRAQAALGRNAKNTFLADGFNNTQLFLAEAWIEWGLGTKWSAFEITERLPLSVIARTRELGDIRCGADVLL